MSDKSYLNDPTKPRGVRNNNPGNLVRSSITWLGKIPFAKSRDTHFEQFISLKYGIRALMRDIISDFKDGKDTVRELINEFAPPHENNTTAYINSVSTAIGVKPDAVLGNLTAVSLKAICKAIVRVENGPVVDSLITDTDYNDAYAILGIELGGIVKKKKNT